MQEASQELKKLLLGIYDPRESSNIAEWVMEDLTGINHIDRIMHSHRILTEEQLDHYHEYVLRLSNGMPVQYVIGYGYFMGLRFRVNEDVLIPRPETEELVQWAIDDKHAPHTGTSLTILDVGTGSGCIPIMLKKIIVTLVASAFALTAFAQAPKSDTTPAAPTKSEKMDKKAAKGEKKTGEKKAKAKTEKKSKAKAKSDSSKAPKAKSDEAKK